MKTSAPAKPGAEHAAPDELLRFLERNPCGPDYLRRTADWIRTTYPDSWTALRPKLQALYRAEARR